MKQHIRAHLASLAASAALCLLSLTAFGATPTPPTNYDGFYDLSDPATQSYITQQLNAAGITASSFPSLFNAISGSQAIYSTADAKGMVIPALFNSIEGSALQPVMLLSPSYSSQSSTVQATNTTSVPNNPTAVVNTIALYNGSTALGSPQGGVVIGGTGVVSSTATANVVSGVKEYVANGIAVYVYPASVLGAATDAQLNVSGTTSIAVAMPLAGSVLATSGSTSIDNVAPTTVKGNPQIYLCFGRNNTNCDYYYPTGVIQMPQIGSVTFPNIISADPTTGVPLNAQISASISLPDIGGGCTMPNSAIGSQVHANGNTLTWNIDPAQFGALCTAYQSSQPYYGTTVTANYTFAIGVKDTSGATMNALITTNQAVTPGNGTLVLNPMEFIYGCLREGTLITMTGKGKPQKIETVQAHQQVLGPNGKGLQVQAYWRGKEQGGMYQITTANKRTVEMTKTHPVPLVDGQVKQAHKLALGDVVTTDKGPSRIVKITLQPYDGTVWNLDLGAPQSIHAPVDMATHSFFANGILVGDGRAQNHLARAMKKSPGEVLSTLPREWHRDFISAQEYMAVRK